MGEVEDEEDEEEKENESEEEESEVDESEEEESELDESEVEEAMAAEQLLMEQTESQILQHGTFMSPSPQPILDMHRVIGGEDDVEIEGEEGNEEDVSIAYFSEGDESVSINSPGNISCTHLLPLNDSDSEPELKVFLWTGSRKGILLIIKRCYLYGGRWSRVK